MRRIYAVIELQESSTFDSSSDDDLDDLAEDMLRIADGVASVTVYSTLADLTEGET